MSFSLFFEREKWEILIVELDIYIFVTYEEIRGVKVRSIYGNEKVLTRVEMRSPYFSIAS